MTRSSRTRKAALASTAAAALAAATTAAVISAGTDRAHAVAHGDDAPEGEYPFAVALSMPEITRADGSTYSSACSGALIAAKWIITAGHCAHDGDGTRVSGKPRYPIVATVGQDTLSGDDGTSVEVVRVVQHESTDVAIAELAEDVTDVEPLAVGEDVPEVQEELRLVGWGSADGVADPAHRPDRLQTAEFEVTRVQDAVLFIEATGPELLTSACPYDSGAPFFREGEDGPELVATEIGGPSCPHSSEETTARADVLADWIDGHVDGEADLAAS